MTPTTPERRPFADLTRLLLGHSARFRSRDLQEVATRALRPDEGAPWVMHVTNASLAVRRRLDHLVRLEPRRLRSRVRYPFAAAGRGTSAPRALSLLCPTRGRVEGLTAFLDSVGRTAVAPGRIEVLCYVDEDDDALPAYRELFARSRWRFGALGACRLVVGPPQGVPAAWNALADAAVGDLLMMTNDDQLYVDHGWDVLLDDRVDDLGALYPDEVLCLYFDAGQYPDGACDFPIVTRPWFETLGYFTPTIFQQWEVEKWVFDIAERLGRLLPVPGVFVEHRHYQDYKAPFDATYQRHRMTREKSYADHALFLRSEQARVQEVDRLRARIAAHPGRSPEAPAEPAPSFPEMWSSEMWFSEMVREAQGPVLDEVDRAGRAEAVLFSEGLWSVAAEDYPVTRALVEGIPEATLDHGHPVHLRTLGPDEVVAGHGEPLVVVGLRLPPGTAFDLDGRPVRPAEGECTLVRRHGALRHHGPGHPVVLTFTVPDADRGR